MKKTGPIIKLKMKPVTIPLNMIKPKVQILSKFRNILAIHNKAKISIWISGKRKPYRY